MVSLVFKVLSGSKEKGVKLDQLEMSVTEENQERRDMQEKKEAVETKGHWDLKEKLDLTGQ